MNLLDFLTAKPVLIGLHLGLAIIGIDAFFWYAGEIIAKSKHQLRVKAVAAAGVVAFTLSWIAGGYYYVQYYGTLVKPGIKSGLAPWAHAVFMETKEHIFLFIVPLALTALFLAFLKIDVLSKGDNSLRKPLLFLLGLIVFLGLTIGLMGFVISAAARWGS